MNYRHAYHAGNFADVVKHAVLSRLIEYLKQKDKAFRVIDTHAGIGRYDLSSTEAQKTGEWQGGQGPGGADGPGAPAGGVGGPEVWGRRGGPPGGGGGK
ncbi:23S rRNA (adenine(2030)-N(6))-methyltransferase RlmJ, partial [Mesorhizobium sp. M1216]|uniref:23S rRNA (adenine(2030)-N(6))-methyltransferase RlmJ n=1 Tax=Mesorhizobium sp. M1216 TaxID=2957069 RepID=UPI003335FCA2